MRRPPVLLSPHPALIVKHNIVQLCVSTQPLVKPRHSRSSRSTSLRAVDAPCRPSRINPRIDPRRPRRAHRSCPAAVSSLAVDALPRPVRASVSDAWISGIKMPTRDEQSARGSSPRSRRRTPRPSSSPRRTSRRNPRPSPRTRPRASTSSIFAPAPPTPSPSPRRLGNASTTSSWAA